jgi:hypothetical protein
VAQAPELSRLPVGEKQALVGRQRILDLAVAREVAGVGDPELLGRLAFGLEEVAAPALGHHPSGLLGDSFAQLEGAGGLSWVSHRDAA